MRLHGSEGLEMNKAPWTPEETTALNRYQQAGWMHPFTCPHGHGDLVATEAGWICEGCSYTQDWAHDFMFKDLSINFAWPSP